MKVTMEVNQVLIEHGDLLYKYLETSLQGMARRMGSPRQVPNRRRRTREVPEPACVQTPLEGRVAHAGGEG